MTYVVNNQVVKNYGMSTYIMRTPHSQNPGVFGHRGHQWIDACG